MTLRNVLLVSLVAALLPLVPSASAVAVVNDAFASALALPFQPITVVGTNAGATTETGEPTPCGAIGQTLWFSFTPPTTGMVNANTFGSIGDTVLAVYTGFSLSSLSLVGCRDDVSGRDLLERSSQVTFLANAGTTYWFQVGGFAGSTVLYQFSLNFEAPFCLEHNPSALINSCIIVDRDVANVPTVGLTPGSGICVIGPVCVSVGSTPVTHQAVSGYVEATALCSMSVPCRLYLP